MVLRKILLVAGIAALMSTPAWATPDQGKGRDASTVPAGPPSTTPNNADNPGTAHRHSGDKGPGHHGKSHKCMPHKVGYVASGTLVSQTLTKNEDGTYSGELTVQVTHANRHASADIGKAVAYTVSKVRLVLALEDMNKDGSVGVDDLAAGDRLHLVGKITTLAKKCNQTEFKAETTIRQIVVHPPAPTTPGDAKS